MNKKIKSREELVIICEHLRKNGLSIGFTSGAFDILHAGHVKYLQEAKAKCGYLIVGVNSDESIKQYKGPNRPIIPQEDRLNLLAALSCVNYVFLFDERRNKTNIELLKPHFYVKAGDYQESELTSAKYLPQGGKIILIPYVDGLSTSKIIEKIQSLPIETSAPFGPAIFLDRDGTLNKEIHFLHNPDQLEILPGVIEGLQNLQKMNYKLVIITNQGGIGLGYYTKEDFFKVNTKMLKIFHSHDIKINKIYYCPHTEADNCNCRKPKIELFNRAQQELNIDMKNSFMIGDRDVDMEAGKNAGLKTISIGQNDADFVVNDLLEASKLPSLALPTMY